MKIRNELKNMWLTTLVTFAESGIEVEWLDFGPSVLMKQKIFERKEDLIKAITDKINNELHQI
jgi:hypothetical protein